MPIVTRSRGRSIFSAAGPGIIAPVEQITTQLPLPFTGALAVADASGTLTGDHPWIDFIGTHGWSVVSGTARLFGTSGIAQGGYLALDTGTDDVAVTLSYPLWSPGTNTLSVGPIVRMPGINVFTGYCAVAFHDVTGSFLVLFRFLNSGQTALGASVPIAPHNGMTVGVSALSNRIRASFDGLTLIDLTDIGIPSGHFVGLQGFNNGTSEVKVDTLT